LIEIFLIETLLIEIFLLEIFLLEIFLIESDTRLFNTERTIVDVSRIA
jgi:hypothetical protein